MIFYPAQEAQKKLEEAKRAKAAEEKAELLEAAMEEEAELLALEDVLVERANPYFTTSCDLFASSIKEGVYSFLAETL